MKKVKFGNFVVTRESERNHRAYRQCVSEAVESYMSNGKLPDSELCLEQKQAFYTTLHNSNKAEHDNIMGYYEKYVSN